MSVIKVIEVLSESHLSWEDAAKQAVAKASKTIHNIKSVYVKDHSATVESGTIKTYRITAKITFLLD